MTVGLPGAGIGGLFYLLAGLLMPVREGWLTITGRSSRARWRAVLHQFSIAGGIAGGTWASGWLLGGVLAWLARPGGAAAGAAGRGTSPVLQQTADWLRPTHGLVQLGTLAAILALTWGLGTLLGRGALAPAPVASPIPETPLPRDLRIPTPGPRTTRDLRIQTPPPWRPRVLRPDEA